MAPVEQTEQAIQSFEGIIDNAQVNISSRATHVLVDENGKTLALLTSSQIALSQYIQKNVQVKGTFEEFPDGENVLNVQELIPVEEPIVQDAATEIWGKYTDQNTPFTFEYPPYLAPEVLGQSIFLNDAEKNTIVKMTRFANPNNQALKIFVNSQYQEVTIGNQVALKVTQPTGSLLYLSVPGEVIKAQFTPLKRDNADASDDTQATDFSQILRSVQPNTTAIKQQTCGGAENILCPQGFRCELIRGNLGKCVDMSQKPAVLDTSSMPTKDTTNTNFEDSNPLKDILPLEGAGYENTKLHFTVQYPSSWWYKSFGPSNGSLWRTEFAEKEIENIGDGSIILTVQNGARGTVLESDGDKVTLLISRDSDSHFEFTGSAENRSTILFMAKSLISQ